jgi:hypothetical protein
VFQCDRKIPGTDYLSNCDRFPLSLQGVEPQLSDHYGEMGFMLNNWIQRSLSISGLLLSAAILLSPAVSAQTGVEGIEARVTGNRLQRLNLFSQSVLMVQLNQQNIGIEKIQKIADFKLPLQQSCQLIISGGNLTKAGSAEIPFQIAIVEKGKTPTSSDFTVPSGKEYRYSECGANSYMKGHSLFIRFVSSKQQTPGNYQGLINLSVVPQ